MESCCFFVIHIFTKLRLAYKGWRNHEKLIAINVIKAGSIVKIISSNFQRELELSDIERSLPLNYEHLQLVYLINGKRYKILYSQDECNSRNILFPLDFELLHMNKKSIKTNPFTDITINYNNEIKSIVYLIDEYLGPDYDFHRNFSNTMKSIKIKEILKINSFFSNDILNINVLDNSFVVKNFTVEDTLSDLLVN